MRLLALALVVLALPAFAGELIRYRTLEGTVGFVDDEKRLPPGVEVLSRTPLDPPAPPPAPPAATPPDDTAADAGPAALPGQAAAALASPAEPVPAGGGDCEALANVLERMRCRSAREERCTHYGLSPGCTPDRIAAAEDWCARGDALREEIAGVDEARDTALSRHDACMRSGGLRPECERDELDEAERAAEVADRRVEALEEQCHAEGCLPGWVREGCEFAVGR